MESPVVIDKPPEYGNANKNTERGFPFDESPAADGAWSELAARHPDIAARLRARPQQWQRKRRPSAHDQEDLNDDFGGFDRFPFDDIPPEFREHFPSHFRRAPPAHPTHSSAPQPPHPAHPAPQQTTSTQTDQPDAPGPSALDPQGIPQYGLRNTVDLGQKSPVDPSVVDAEDRTQRSMSAPPETRQNMNGASPPQSDQPPPSEHASNVRHIPIFVEGRDEPVINKTDHAEPKPQPHQHQHAPPPQPHQHQHQHAPPPQPHFDREQYFTDDGPAGFHHPTNFSRAFGTPFNKNFRQGPQPFTQQKAFPQSAFRGDSPHRSQSPKREVPVHHEPPKEARPPPTPQQQQQQYQQEQQQKFQQQEQRQPTPPPKQPLPNDPITLILSVQTDVLNLMTEVENFTGSKQDKRYMYLDEMLTRNLIKLDNVETEGKENIRLARKEAIRCIQKCIAVLEAKAEKGTQEAAAAAVPAAGDNGDVAMETKEAPQEAAPAPTQEEQPQAVDTRPEQTEAKPEEKSPKKKVAKSKSNTSNKVDTDKVEEPMQVDTNSQMEVEGASASQ